MRRASAPTPWSRLSSAVIMASSLMLTVQLRGDGFSPDPLRAIQGLSQAIGFIAAGVDLRARRQCRQHDDRGQHLDRRARSASPAAPASIGW